MRRKNARARRWGGACVALAALLGCRAAWGQAADEEEGIVFGERKRPPKFALAPLHGNVALVAQSTSTTRDYKLGEQTSSAESSSLALYELLTLGSGAYFFHPNIVDMNFSGTLGFSQTSIDASGLDTQDQNSTVYGWNVAASILRSSPYPSSVYTYRTESLVNQPFGETLKSTDTTYGGTLNINSRTLPTSFRLYRTETTQSSLTDTPEFTIAQNVFEWQTEWRPTQYQSLSWSYYYGGSEQSIGALEPDGRGDSLTTDAQAAALSHYISFGPDHRYSLGSSGSISESTGLYDAQTLMWNENLTMVHSSTLSTDVTYWLNRNEYDTVEQQTQRAQARFRHRLYESLRTVGTAGVTQMDLSDDSQTQDIFADLELDYRKKIPRGLLLGQVGLHYATKSSDSRSDELPVINQPFSFADATTPIIINRPDIVPGSIVIKDNRAGPLKGQIFSPISDYQVTQFPGYVQIDRMPGGRIPFGIDNAVLMDYKLEPEPANDVTTTAFNLGLRYDIQEGALRGLSPYVRYYWQDQSLSASGPTLLRADQVQDVTAGAEYRIGNLRVMGEYEVRDGTLLSFDAMRLRADYTHRLSMETVLNLNTAYAVTSFSEPADELTTLTATAAVSHQLSRRWSLSGGVTYLSTESDLGGETVGLEENVSLNWKYRQTEMYLQFRNSSLESDQQDQTFQYLQIGIRREF